MNKYLVSTALASLFLLPTFTTAQVERLPGVIDRNLPEDVEIPESYSLDSEQQSPIGDKPTEDSIAEALEEIGTFDTITFSGNTVISDQKIQNLIDPYLNRPLNELDLATLKFDIKNIFFQEGYILVKVVTPPQDVTDGSLEIFIYEARIGDLYIKENDVLNPYVANALAERINKGDVFQESNTESMVNDINDLKNIQATLNLQPGKEFGTSDLYLTLDETYENKQSFSVDNYGSELTGTGVATAHLEYSNLFNFGETFSSDFRYSDQDLMSIAVGVDTPIGYRNLMLELDYLYSENDIGDRLAALDASGESNVFNAAISSTVVNGLKSKAVVRVGIEAREHKSFLVNTVDTKDDIRQLYVGGSYLHRADNAVFYTAATLKRGIDAFGASQKGDTLASRTAGNPEALIFRPVFVSNIRTSSSTFEPLNGILKLSATGQFASDTLLSSDLFVIGGYGSVRGFEPAQETGESGLQFSVEYQYPALQNEHFSLSVGPFFDGGTVSNRVSGSSADNTLYSTGVGAEISGLSNYIEDAKVRLDWATPVGDYASPEVEGSTFYFRLSKEI